MRTYYTLIIKELYHNRLSFVYLHFAQKSELILAENTKTTIKKPTKANAMSVFRGYSFLYSFTANQPVVTTSIAFTS